MLNKNTFIKFVHMVVKVRKARTVCKYLHSTTQCNSRPIYMIVLTSALDVSYDVKRAQCN